MVIYMGLRLDLLWHHYNLIALTKPLFPLPLFSPCLENFFLRKIITATTICPPFGPLFVQYPLDTAYTHQYNGRRLMKGLTYYLPSWCSVCKEHYLKLPWCRYILIPTDSHCWKSQGWGVTNLGYTRFSDLPTPLKMLTPSHAFRKTPCCYTCYVPLPPHSKKGPEIMCS